MSENSKCKCVRLPHVTWMKVINNPLSHAPIICTCTHTHTHTQRHTRRLYCGNPFILPAAGLKKRADINKCTSLVSSLSLPTNTRTRADTHTHAHERRHKHALFRSLFWLCTLHIPIMSADGETSLSAVASLEPYFAEVGENVLKSHSRLI